MSSLRHRIVFALALVSTLAVGVVGGIAFQRKVETFKPFGFEAERLASGWSVRAVDDPATGLEPGDEIIQVAGDTPRDLRTLRALLHAEPSTELVVRRGGALARVLYDRPRLAIEVAYLVLAGVGMVYLLIGLYTAFKEAQRHARLFFLWCLTSATLYALSPALAPQDRLDELIFVLDQVARTLLPALTLHLFLVFPAGIVPLGRLRAATAFLYLPSAALLAVHGDLLYLGGRFAGPPTAAKLALLERLELVLLVAFALAGVVALLIRLGRHPDWEERRQVHWIVAGMLGGYVPFLLLYVVPRTLGLDWSSWLTTGAVVPLALVPLGFAYAILKYKLWDIGVVLRDTIAYTITVMIGLSGFALVNLAISRGVAADLVAVRQVLSFAAGLVLAGVMVPTKGAIARRVERLHYGPRLAARRTLAEVGRELVLERDLDRLCDLLLARLTEGLGVERINLYLATEGGMVPVQPSPELPNQLPADAFDEAFWTRGVDAISAVALPAEAPSPAQRLFAAGFRYAFPLRVRAQRVGALVLGYKDDDAPLDSHDVDLARVVLDQAALAIENARLLDEVQRRLDEVTRLEAFSHSVIESSPAGLAVLDGDGRVVSANHAFAALVERERRTLAGQMLADLLPVRPLPGADDGLLEVSYCEASGRERYLQLQMATFQQAAGERLRLLLAQDISDRVAMEQALQEKERLAALGMLAAGVAHEVNTPLTGISSYAQLLLADAPADSPQRSLLEKMERQTFRASQIVNNLLEFARNRGDAHPLSVASVIDECVDNLSERAAEAGVSVDWQPPAAGPEVEGHEGELHQMFTNLMVNAIDAMAAQPVDKPRVLSVELDREDGRVRTRIRDTGPGIPPERMERIFQPFFSSKLHQGGTGLGLAISYNIVRRHGGEIRAENRSPRGCAFTVCLPARLAASAERVPRPA